jgi:hypothetical protein
MSGTYTLTIAVNGCSSDTSEAVVEIEQSPEPPNVNNNSPLCAGLELSLSAASDPGAIYLWTGPNGFTSQEQNPIVSTSSTSNESGNYEVVATIGNCTSTSAATWVIVHPIPDAPIATSNAPIDEGSILSLMSSSVAEANYLWTGPNGFTSNEQNPTVSTNASMPMAGLYAVQVMVNGCLSDFSSVSVQINEANTIDDSNVNSSVRIYPNPAHDQLSLELLGEGFKNVEIVNALGSVVLRQYISQKKMNLNIASIAPGLYIIVLQGEGLRVEEKIYKY